MSEQPENGQERTEEPTPRRLQQARDKGQVARSRELNTVAVLFGGACALYLLGPGIIDGMAELVVDAWSFERETAFRTDTLTQRLGQLVFEAFVALVPLAVILFLIAMLSPMALGGLALSAQSMAPKLDKLNPVTGLKRVFGPQGLMELLKALAKFTLISAAGVLVLWGLSGDIIELGGMALVPALGRAAGLVGWSFIILSAVLLIIAMVDVPFQLWQHARQLRMTMQEVKDDLKDTEGRPEVRAEVKKRQREMAQSRMMEDVPRADVVVTNPTEYAVALQYEREQQAPRVVAKGVDHVARNIRGIAAENGVQFVEAPPLARALYQSTDIGQEIPASLFLAVARVLAYVYQLKASEAGANAQPPAPEDLPVPASMDPRNAAEKAR